MRDRRTNWKDDDQGFRDWATLGYEWQRPVLDALLAAGLPAVMPKLELRDHVSEAWTYANQADILVRKDAGYRIEVKSMAFAFRRAADWPYSEVRMDPVDKWRGKVPKPFAYAFVSRVTAAILAVPGADESRMGRAYRVRDPERGTVNTWVTMPRTALVSMTTLCQVLKDGGNWWSGLR